MNPIPSLLRALFLATALLAAWPASAQYRIMRPAREITVYVDGERVRFDGVKPLRRGRYIMIPMRGVFERMGATVRYDARRNRVLASRGETRVVMSLNGANRRAFVNGEGQRLDALPLISKGRVLVPIRFVAETLDAGVAYSAPDATVRIMPH